MHRSCHFCSIVTYRMEDVVVCLPAAVAADDRWWLIRDC